MTPLCLSRELTTILRILLLALIILITGCQVYAPPMPDEEQSAGSDPSQQRSTAPGASDSSQIPPETLAEVVEALDQGRVAAAEAALLRIIDQQPYSRLALRFLEQIQSDPIVLMGEAYDVVNVQPGDSLSEIAERELGDAMQFFALARYNAIQAPRQMAPGTALKIPRSLRPADGDAVSSESTPDELGEPDPAPVVEGPAGAGLELAARNLQSRGQTTQAFSLLLAGARAGNLHGDGERLLAELALKRAEARADEGRLAEALALLDEIDAVTSEAPREVLRSGRRAIEALKLQEEAVEARRAGELDSALVLFEEAAERDPDNAVIEAEADKIRDVIVAQLHEQALTHYRDQELQQAIALWQRVEMLAPDFESARIYLERALALRARVRELD